MPPRASAKSGAGPGEPKQPTAQEALLFYTVIKNMKGKPDIDWAGVAADSGFKNPETAKVSSLPTTPQMFFGPIQVFGEYSSNGVDSARTHWTTGIPIHGCQ